VTAPPHPAPEKAASGGRPRHWSVIDSVLALAIFGAVAWFVTLPERTASRVKPGMTKDETVAAVGRPANLEAEALAICASNGWARCADAKKSGAVRYLMWRTYIDAELIVGMCADGRVCFIGQKE